jgi:hypothetical protein
MRRARVQLAFAITIVGLTILADPTSARAEVGVANDAALDVGVGFELFSRYLRYEDDLHGFLRPYDLGAGPAVAIDARWYPGRHFTEEWPAIFGIEMAFQRSFAIVSERSDGARFPTVNRNVDVNALARFMIRRHALVGRFGYGSHLYELRRRDPSQPSTGILVPDVPSVEYRYLRYGVESRLAILDWFGAVVGASFLQVLDAGGLESEIWFPHLSGHGAELDVGAVFALGRGFEARASLTYRRYFFAFNPVPGYEDIIAGGALDQFVFYTASVAYRF